MQQYQRPSSGVKRDAGPKLSAAEAKKLEEEKKLKELEDARRQAYKEKKELMARAKARE